MGMAWGCTHLAGSWVCRHNSSLPTMHLRGFTGAELQQDLQFLVTVPAELLLRKA